MREVQTFYLSLIDESTPFPFFVVLGQGGKGEKREERRERRARGMVN